MKFIEIHTRIMKKKENLICPRQNYENHEFHTIPIQNHENQEIPIIPHQNHETS